MRLPPHVRRAAGLVLLAVTLATACTFLGRWQWNRHVNRDAQIRLVQQNYDSDPVALSTLLPGTDATLDPDDVWRQVTVTGTYDTDATVLLRNRPVNSEPGFHVLVPLVLDAASSAAVDGQPVVLVVDRGWVAWDEDASGEITVPDPPSGTVTVTVRLRQDEPASDRDAPDGQVQAINVAQVLAAGGLTAGTDEVVSYEAYGALAEESPAPATALGALPEPSTDPGSHLSYAFQWWVFALGSLIGFTWMARRELQEGRTQPEPSTTGPPPAASSASGPPPAASAPARPGPAPRRRRPTDEETEDALIDAQQP
ncbi:MAG TPA: SURF1 family protein [Cellulomonas sp.]